ncbi:hypothetical protein [Mesonia maritima]|uniref:Uncharacterized protein n=1 Tax=Mesonia maritima TaxID=1793873 RepID=A0ABU1K688_9FLAO|nr:hypothetical protein [Mesonia maritima]MDR6301126.1 hypothetical protein [Mesonia maritima]
MDIIFRSVLNSGTTLNQAKADVHKRLGVSQVKIFAWKPHSILKIDSENDIILVESESGKIIPIESDKKTTQNLILGISENQFLSKYGNNFINEIKSWNFSYSLIRPPVYKVYLRTKLKTEDQISKKRKKMYHKRKIIVSEFFIKNLVEKTI